MRWCITQHVQGGGWAHYEKSGTLQKKGDALYKTGTRNPQTGTRNPKQESVLLPSSLKKMCFFDICEKYFLLLFVHMFQGIW